MWNGFKKWELALAAAFLVALLVSPVEGRQIPLSRWSLPQWEAQVRYQISLFPFAVGERDEAACSVVEQSRSLPEYELRFWIRDWWEQIRRARDP